MKNNNADSIWVKLKKEITGEENDIFIGTWYLSPQKGKDGNDKMEALSEEIIYFQKKGLVIINGDLNAKTGVEDDFVIPDKYNDLTNIQHGDAIRKRNSQDKTLNERGRFVLNMCKGLDLHIVNGRKTGDVFGKFTSIQWNGNSVVDYVITAESLFEKISTFQVGEFVPWLSDHCPLKFSLELNKIKQSNPINKMVNGPVHFIWSDHSKINFHTQLSKQDTRLKIDEIVNSHYEDPTKMSSELTEILIKTAKQANVKTISNKKGKRNPPWFDSSCEKLKKRNKIDRKEN